MSNEINAASYDNWKTTPPDEPELERCPGCDEHECECEAIERMAQAYECIGSQADALPPGYRGKCAGCKAPWPACDCPSDRDQC